MLTMAHVLSLQKEEIRTMNETSKTPGSLTIYDQQRNVRLTLLLTKILNKKEIRFTHFNS